MIYYRARYYDPSIGRFVSRDPIGLGGGINQYAYTANSPVNFTDPLGLLPASPLQNMLAAGSSNYFSNTMTDIGDGLSSGFQKLSSSVKQAWDTSPAVAIGKDFGALAAAAQGVVTGNQALVDTAIQGMAENKQANVDALLMLGTMGRGGAKAGVPGEDFIPSANVSQPYIRPSGAGPTTAQKAAVQGQPCVDCGAVTSKQVADHIDPLVVQYYREGAVNIQQQSSVDAVQPHCPSCSASQGGQLGAFSKKMKQFFGF